jgi:hypothetical protein
MELLCCLGAAEHEILDTVLIRIAHLPHITLHNQAQVILSSPNIQTLVVSSSMWQPGLQPYVAQGPVRSTVPAMQKSAVTGWL